MIETVALVVLASATYTAALFATLYHAWEPWREPYRPRSTK